MEEKQAQEKTAPAENCRGSFRRLRLQNGMAVLFASMGAMLALAAADGLLSRDGNGPELVRNAFEAFKLIAVTVLGYIFGADRTKQDM